MRKYYILLLIIFFVCAKFSASALVNGVRYINPNSQQVVKSVFAEPALINARFRVAYQFISKGYFVLDKDGSSGMVFNRTVGLKHGWKK